MKGKLVEKLAQFSRSTVLEDNAMKQPTDVEVMLRLHAQGWGIKRIARELGVSKNTVRKYIRHGGPATFQTPDRSSLLDGLEHWLETTFYQHRGNAAVVLQELQKQHDIKVDLRTVQRAVAPYRRFLRAKAKATVRFETAPGQQLQADFGSTSVLIDGVSTRIHLCVLTLGYSRRIYVEAFTHERRQNWLRGIEGAFLRFGGVTDEILVDNARALVDSHDVACGKVVFNSVFADFCAWWGVRPVACAPYRARTKGKDENAVGYVKKNAIAGHQFQSWTHLQQHLVWWMDHISDVRIHGTTAQRPIDCFDRHERAALKAVGSQRRYPSLQSTQRKVNSECCVVFETNSYSVPWRLIGLEVTVRIDEQWLHILHQGQQVAYHPRCRQRRQRIINKEHLDGVVQNRADLQRQLKQPSPEMNAISKVPAQVLTSTLQRPLQEYEELIGGGW